MFEAVVTEIGQLFPDANAAALSRYEPDGTLTMIGRWSSAEGHVPIGERYPLASGTVGWLIAETRRPGRVTVDSAGLSALPGAIRSLGWHSVVGAPIVVEDRLWGLVGIASTGEDLLPPDTEARLAEFCELVATGIANAESRSELAASRARLLATADATRRRIERDLHDGAQQHLVSLALDLRAAESAVPHALGDLRAELSRVAAGLASVIDELRETALGIHPAILAEGGLGPALKTLARRSSIPVNLDVGVGRRMPESVEVAAYYVVAEALTNPAKHARASVVDVSVSAPNHLLRVSIRDDGIGGADPSRGSGLLGLSDRVEAIHGVLSIESPPDEGTLLQLELPCDAPGG